MATGKSGADAGFCLRTWRPGCGFRAVCVAAQALWSNISVRLHTPRRPTGRAPGGWKDSPSTTTAAAAPKPSPAAALFMLIGASPRIQWLQKSIDCDQRGYALTGRDLAGAKPPPALTIVPTSVCRYVGHIAGSPSTGPGRQGGDHDVVYVGMRKAMRATVVLEGGDHPALGLDRREPAEARALQELERRIVC